MYALKSLLRLIAQACGEEGSVLVVLPSMSIRVESECFLTH